LRGAENEEKQRGAARLLTTLTGYLHLIRPVAKAGATIVAAAKPEYAFPAMLGAEGLAQVTGVVEQAAFDQRTIAELAKKTLAETKQALSEAFAQRSGRILIVIDDIDRLTEEEIRLVFQLVRSTADFPKFIFLLLFDRQVITTALNKAALNKGDAYLEKIVQAGFDVPSPDWGELLEILKDEVQSIIGTSREVKNRFDAERWERFAEQLRPYFSTIRAVRRITNSIRFSFALFKRDGGFDANFEDIFALEALRNYVPRLYQELSELKTYLAPDPLDVAAALEDRAPRADQQRQERLNGLLELADTKCRTGIRKVLHELFPNARWSSARVDPQGLLGSMRVGHSANFNRYFQLVVPRHAIRSREINSAINNARDSGAFQKLLRQYLAAGRLGLLAEHLRANASKLAPNARNVLSAVFAVGDEIEPRSWYFLGSTQQNELANLARDVLEQVTDRNERAEILLAAIQAAPGLSMPYHLVVPECNEDRRNQRPPETFLTDAMHVERLKSALVGKIEAMKDMSVVLDTTGSIGALLYTWEKFGGVAQAGSWLRSHRRNHSLMWAFLLASISWKERDPELGIDSVSIEWLNKFLSLEELDSIIQDLSNDDKMGKRQSDFITAYKAARRAALP
jgi:KAP-like P-loop domain-containing protein